MVKNEISEDKWRWGDPFGDDFNRHEGPNGDITPFGDITPNIFYTVYLYKYISPYLFTYSYTDVYIYIYIISLTVFMSIQYIYVCVV